jgi:Na+/melibiose symporter-like transporter
MPLTIFQLKSVAGANAVGFLFGATLFSMFFMLTLYTQVVLGFSPLKTGISFLAVAGTSVAAAGLAEAMLTKVSPKVVMAIGLFLAGVGMLWYSQVSVDGSFVVDLLPGMLITGVAVPLVFIPVSISSLTGVDPRRSGVASGLIETNQQLGGALGLAMVTTIFTQHSASLIKDGKPPLEALTAGFGLAFLVIGIIAFVALIASVILLRNVHIPVHPEEAEHVAATSCFAPNLHATKLNDVLTADSTEQPSPAPG